VWAASSAYRIGPYLLGVRSSAVTFDALLQDVLAAHLIRGADAPPNFSVQIAERGGGRGGAHPLHLLFWASQVVVRSRSLQRTARALLGYLNGYALSDPNGMLKIEAVGFVRDGKAVLAPGHLRFRTERVEPRLRRRGVQTVDGTATLIDAATGELVVPETVLQADLSPFDALDGLEEPSGAPGRYRIVGWAFDRPSIDLGSLSRARAVMLAAAQVPNLVGHPGGTQQVLDGLRAVFRHARPALLDESEAAWAGTVLTLLDEDD
jgi:hypothetical protein